MSEVPRKVKNVVHDFDGTLADSGAINLEAMAIVLRRDPFTREEAESLRSLTTLESMKKLGVKKRQLPRLIVQGQRIVGRNMHRIGVFEGIPDAIDRLHEKGYAQYVLSTNSSDNIWELLGRHGLAGSIAEVYGGAGMLSKAKRLAALIKKEDLVAAECVYTGDETRDIEAARKAGVHCAAVTWGFQDADLLAAYEPDVLVESPSELVAAIDSLSQ